VTTAATIKYRANADGSAYLGDHAVIFAGREQQERAKLMVPPFRASGMRAYGATWAAHRRGHRTLRRRERRILRKDLQR